jgi:alpha-beta hydrolase superfamily lysophospholipase
MFVELSRAHMPRPCMVYGCHERRCWAEKFMPALADAGIDSYAISFRGHVRSFTLHRGLKQAQVENSQLPALLQGRSPKPADAQKGQAAGTLQSHAEDVAAVLRSLPLPPLLVGHSFGGLIIHKYLQLSETDQQAFPAPPGVAFMASSPPGGISPLRYLFSAPMLTVQVHTCSHFLTNRWSCLQCLQNGRLQMLVLRASASCTVYYADLMDLLSGLHGLHGWLACMGTWHGSGMRLQLSWCSRTP